MEGRPIGGYSRGSNALEERVLEEYGSLHMFVFDPGGIKTIFSYSRGPAWPSCLNLHSNVAAISGYSPRGQGEFLGARIVRRLQKQSSITKLPHIGQYVHEIPLSLFPVVRPLKSSCVQETAVI
ncbi:hypothetical protein V8G54_036552 [Vigna mungo]|uniref:Uncharacterized protein n=1 Tax=Vigna mungo TaxID=3915 RepID=A0AAQ3RCX2_VIGMU